jgi:hypothetical protein
MNWGIKKLQRAGFSKNDALDGCKWGSDFL